MLRLHSRRTAPVKRYARSQIRSEFRNTFTEYIRRVLYAAFQYDSHVIEYRGTKIGYALRGNISIIFFSFYAICRFPWLSTGTWFSFIFFEIFEHLPQLRRKTSNNKETEDLYITLCSTIYSISMVRTKSREISLSDTSPTARKEQAANNYRIAATDSNFSAPFFRYQYDTSSRYILTFYLSIRIIQRIKNLQGLRSPLLLKIERFLQNLLKIRLE